ncbi:DUF4334 domain-containing protein [Hoyosella subflava]|uniref:GXWXG domain-containing protein n=1 Tax=Hoyosella subflava (strain DSM 45089 / JCM 17490 / NBRC 109087 / DQS3-9A1) TaxID=443218 RepID=F6EMW4_HOYSD|nr:DUF4334 domain-containing protein [Hoyosella subflava]AEF42856.1 hypothetical protein AS9A_4423 [Hoyosella subflava DQS3-9A1]
MNLTDAHARFHDLQQHDGPVDPAELDQIWGALEPVRADEIFGEWEGAEFTTGHPLCGTLEKIRWHGKNFNSLLDAQPLICRDDSGALYSNTETMGGEASLWNIEFRGEITATMVYDMRPVFDHFKKVDASTLMGIMNGKGVTPRGQHFYFVLTRAS